jgi:hypothetical protein
MSTLLFSQKLWGLMRFGKGWRNWDKPRGQNLFVLIKRVLLEGGKNSFGRESRAE